MCIYIYIQLYAHILSHIHIVYVARHIHADLPLAVFLLQPNVHPNVLRVSAYIPKHEEYRPKPQNPKP